MKHIKNIFRVIFDLLCGQNTFDEQATDKNAKIIINKYCASKRMLGLLLLLFYFVRYNKCNEQFTFGFLRLKNNNNVHAYD